MNSGQSQINHRAYEGARARDLLSRHPEAQAERIADHYACLSATAATLRKLVQMQRHRETTPESDQVIEYLVRQIKEAHWHDLGIELAWPDESLHRALQDMR